MTEAWKKRWKMTGIGAGVGVVLFLAIWLLEVRILDLGLFDSCFFLGLGLLIVGLLFGLQGGPSAKYSAFTVGRNKNGAMVQDMAMEKEPSKRGEAVGVFSAPYILAGAGVVNMLACALMCVAALLF